MSNKSRDYMRRYRDMNKSGGYSAGVAARKLKEAGFSEVASDISNTKSYIYRSPDFAEFGVNDDGSIREAAGFEIRVDVATAEHGTPHVSVREARRQGSHVRHQESNRANRTLISNRYSRPAGELYSAQGVGNDNATVVHAALYEVRRRK